MGGIMMAFTQTRAGGRVAVGNTPYGRYRIEWDRDRQVLQEFVTYAAPPRAPLEPPPDPGSRIVPPGDWFSAVVYVVTMGRVTSCGPCDSRRKWLNCIGWRGLFNRIRRII